MQKHTKIYLEFFGYDVSDFIACEICDEPGTDIHHIVARGMGGSKTRDFIENLMALCRGCHDKYGDIEQFKEYLILIHSKNMENAFSDISHLTDDGLQDCKIALEANLEDCKRDRKIQIHASGFQKRLDQINTEIEKRANQATAQ